MADRQELILQHRYEAASKAFDLAIRQAREAVRAKNQAQRDYKRALDALVAYRERKPKEIQ